MLIKKAFSLSTALVITSAKVFAEAKLLIVLLVSSVNPNPFSHFAVTRMSVVNETVVLKKAKPSYSLVSYSHFLVLIAKVIHDLAWFSMT